MARRASTKVKKKPIKAPVLLAGTVITGTAIVADKNGKVFVMNADSGTYRDLIRLD